MPEISARAMSIPSVTTGARECYKYPSTTNSRQYYEASNELASEIKQGYVDLS